MKWILKGICIAAVITLAILGFGYITMHLWNWLMPVLFKLPLISFSQALGLLILSKILFSGFGGKRGHRHCGHRGWGGQHRGGMWKKRWEEKMANMTPEQREKVKQEWSKCGWGGSWKDDYCGDEKTTVETDSKI
jgi:hypothetical protein